MCGDKRYHPDTPPCSCPPGHLAGPRTLDLNSDSPRWPEDGRKGFQAILGPANGIPCLFVSALSFFSKNSSQPSLKAARGGKLPPRGHAFLCVADTCLKGHRDEVLMVASRIASLQGVEKWEVVLALDEILEKIAGSAEERLAWQRQFLIPHLLS
jgi:hypothetical protein